MSSWKKIVEQSSGWSPEALAEVLLQTRDQKKQNRYFVVTCGSNFRYFTEVLKDDLISFGKAFGLDEYTTTQRMKLKAPRIWKAVSSKTKAEDWVVWMRELGILGYFVEEKRIENLQFKETKLLEFHEDYLCVEVEKKRLDLPWTELPMIVSGELIFKERFKQSSDALEDQKTADVKASFVDIHLLGKREILRLVNPHESKFKTIASKTKRMKQPEDFIDLMNEYHPALTVYDQFESAEHAYGDSLQLVSQHQTISQSKGLKRAVQRVSLDIEKVLETNPLPLFDLYSVLCRYEFRQSP